MPQTAPYGSWKSPITSQTVVEKSLKLGNIYLDGNILYWTEGRPEEKGRVTIMRSINGEKEELLSKDFNARTTVHEYGGSALAVRRGIIYFSNFEDQRIYRLNPGTSPEPLTPEAAVRYADFSITNDGNTLYCVREDHRGEEVVNALVKIDTKNPSIGDVIAEGCDFYAAPRLSPNDDRLAWICWNHPNMPWDGTELFVAETKDINGTRKKIAGGQEISIFQPEWSPTGELYYISDESGYWNLYSESGGNLLPMEAEFGLPLWVFGMRTYDFIQEKIACTYSKNGSHLILFDPKTKETEEIKTPYSSLSDIKASSKKIHFIGGAPNRPMAVASYDIGSKSIAIQRENGTLSVDPAYLAIPEYISFPTQNDREAYAWYYKPTNPDFQAPEGELPPLLVRCHGGPTAHSSDTLSLQIQYWTSRGFAFLNVNYGGSTGHGRAYRERLKGNWGIIDKEDACNAAKHLVNQHLADPERLAIDGGSAGGYTTLCALTFTDTFKAGASLYGVSDLTALAKHTHKFESHYLDLIVGPYPEREDIYKDRSPINHTEKLSCPIILLQGLEDKVVPPEQSEAMYEALKAKGIPTAYITFEKEQHGFRASENIIKALEAEFYFFSKMFDFVPADDIPPISID